MPLPPTDTNSPDYPHAEEDKDSSHVLNDFDFYLETQ